MPAEPENAAALVVCRQLADGLKHFLGKTRGAAAHEGSFGTGFDPSGFDTNNTWIYLNPAEAATFGREYISAIDIERLLLAYWERVFAAP